MTAGGALFKTFYARKFGNGVSECLFVRQLVDGLIVSRMKQLKVGSKAPELVGEDQFGRPVRLSDHRGEHIVLYFYPKDDTPACTAQACALRDAHATLQEAGFVVIGVSPDTVSRHQKFATKHGLPFRLLADPDLTVTKTYGVWGPKKFMGRTYDGVHRTTFIIDPQGRIARIIEKVNTKEHAHQVLAGGTIEVG
jgi:peroxiredoxin Q/BCP